MEESIIKTEEGNKNGYSIANVYEEFLSFRQRRVSTLKLYAFAFRLFVDFIGTESVLIKDINSKQVSNFINWLGENYSGNSGYVVYCIIKSLFNYADKHYYLDVNPINLIDTRRRLNRQHHHQALTDRQMAICENDFWHSFDTSKNGKWQSDMLTDIKSDAFFRMCFMLGYYLQGLALVDVLSLRVTQVKLRKATGESMYVIETCRRKTGKGVKIVIPESHANHPLPPLHTHSSPGPYSLKSIYWISCCSSAVINPTSIQEDRFNPWPCSVTQGSSTAMSCGAGRLRLDP